MGVLEGQSFRGSFLKNLFFSISLVLFNWGFFVNSCAVPGMGTFFLHIQAKSQTEKVGMYDLPDILSHQSQ